MSGDDPTFVTGLIDWQSTSVEPAFVYANETPDFADNVLLADDGPPAGERETGEDKKYKDALVD